MLFDHLRKWLATADAPGWQALLRLSKYLSRAVAKTSPYATFTMVGRAQWTERGPAVTPLSSWSWHSAVELNGWLTQHAARTVTRQPELADTLRIRLNPSAVEEGSTVWFLGAGPSEPLTGLTLTGTLRACLSFLDRTSEPTMGAVRQYLHALDGGHHGRQAIDDYVHRIVETGLLEPVSPVADQAHDHLGTIVAWLRDAPNTPASAPVAQAHRVLRGLHAQLQEYPGLRRAEDRAARHDAIRHTLTDHAAAVLGGSPLPSKNLIDENAVLTGPVLRCGWRHWRPALEDLDAVRHLAGLFARDLPVKLATAAVFTTLYGTGAEVGFLDFYRSFQRCLATGGSSVVDYLAAVLGNRAARLSDNPVGPIRALEELRRDTLTLLRSASPDDRGVIAVDPDWVRRIAGSWPEHVRPPSSIACHVQALTDPDGALRLVLNGIAPGHGQSQARLRRLLDLAGGAQGDEDPGAALGDQPDPLLVEARGVFNSNLNRRAAMAAHDLDYPFTVSDRPPDQRIALTDLVVSVEAAQGLPCLHHRRTGTLLRPVHLGGMADTFLPPALRLLIAAFGEQPTPALPSWLLWDGPTASAVDTVLRLSRVDIGRITLARAAWYLRAGELPLRHKGESDAAFLLRFVARWDELGIPERCFVRVLHHAPGQRQAGMSVGKDRKPLYLDIANWFSLTVFQRAIQHPRDVVVVHEALPDLAAAPRYGAAGQRVTEYIIEIPPRAP